MHHIRMKVEEARSIPVHRAPSYDHLFSISAPGWRSEWLYVKIIDLGCVLWRGPVGSV